jgi:hypothetical protein
VDLPARPQQARVAAVQAAVARVVAVQAAVARVAAVQAVAAQAVVATGAVEPAEPPQ